MNRRPARERRRRLLQLAGAACLLAAGFFLGRLDSQGISSLRIGGVVAFAVLGAILLRKGRRPSHLREDERPEDA